MDDLHDDGAMQTLRDFGAVGDGVTDDTEALQRAFASGELVSCGDARYLVRGLSTAVFDQSTVSP